MSDPKLELSITRHIAAPPATVWQVMTDRMAEWWCPQPWTVEIVEQDRRPGGRSAMVMKGPNGEAMPQEGIFLAYDEGRRFAFTDALDADLNPHGPFMVGIFEIAAEDGGTRYTASARHWTEEALQQHKDMGFEQGWGVVADQLKALCEA
ncbi:SRPBCC family protein [Novosphingobium lentum]|uniref:SRPBCC family protein n=1 Tax=Novosphingobium lentum TaxID=145287 RepID=UPI000834069C|nr:SRPBCC family protein [Novosphingobium lentum]